MEPQAHRFRLFRTEPLFHDLGVTAAQGAELCDFLEKVCLANEEESQARSEIVDVDPGFQNFFHVNNEVRQGKRRLM